MIAYDQYELLTPNGNQARFLLRRDTNDLNVVYSICAADEYQLAGRSFEGWALDLGAHIGGVAICLAIDNPALHVTTVEPVPANAELIHRHAELNGVVDRLTILDAAIGEPGTTTKIRFGFRNPAGGYDHHAWVGNASMVYADPPVEAHDELEVSCIDFQDLYISESRGGPPAFVKVDAEGGEWAALEQLVALRSPRVIGEWHPVCGRDRADELVAAFQAAGYTVETSGPIGGPGLFLATR